MSRHVLVCLVCLSLALPLAVPAQVPINVELSVTGPLLTSRQRCASVSTNTDLGTGSHPDCLYVTTGAGGVTITLPEVVSGTDVRTILILKVDSGAGALTLARSNDNNDDTMNGSAANRTTTTQWAGFVVQEQSANNWHLSLLQEAGDGGGTPGGSVGQVQWNNTTFAGSAGLLVDATSIVRKVEHLTASAASITPLGDHNVIACDAAGGTRTYTLPTAATTTLGQTYALIKSSATDANECRFAPDPDERINNLVDGTLGVTGQFEEVFVTLVSTNTPNWQGTRTYTQVGTAQIADAAVTGPKLGVVVRSFFLPAGTFDVSGSCAVGASAVLLTNGPKTVAITCTDANTDSIEAMVTMPDGWDGGTLLLEASAFNVGTNASPFVYEISWIAKCVGSTEAPGAWAAVNHTTDVATSFSLTITDNLLYQATSAALTPVGGCAAGDTLFLKGEIDASATTMTPMGDLKLLGVKVEYTRSGND